MSIPIQPPPPTPGLSNAYEEKHSADGSPVFLCPHQSSLAGFIFGFDTVVISGAEEAIQKLWHLSPG